MRTSDKLRYELQLKEDAILQGSIFEIWELQVCITGFCDATKMTQTIEISSKTACDVDLVFDSTSLIAEMGETQEWPLAYNPNPDDCPAVYDAKWSCKCLTIEQEGDYIIIKLQPVSGRDSAYVGTAEVDFFIDLPGVEAFTKAFEVTIIEPIFEVLEEPVVNQTVTFNITKVEHDLDLKPLRVMLTEIEASGLVSLGFSRAVIIDEEYLDEAADELENSDKVYRSLQSTQSLQELDNK